MGTEATLLRYVTSPDGTHHAICQGERRFRVLDFVDGYPFLAARVEHIPEVESISKDIAARLLNLRNQAVEVLQLLPQVPAELVNAVQSVTSAPALADLIASFMDITPAEKQEILETVAIGRRLSASRIVGVPARCCGCRARSATAPGKPSTSPARVPVARAAGRSAGGRGR
jgi:ATP-dependent Lon protease